MFGLGLGLGMPFIKSGGGTVNPAPPVTSGLVGDYNPDLGYIAGTSWADQSGSGNTLTLTGTTAGAAQHGHATVSFANTDIAQIASFALGGSALTMIIAINGTTTAGANQQVMAYNATSLVHTMYWHEASIGPAYWNGNNTAISGPAINGAWHRLCATDTGVGTGNVALFVDNVAVNPAVNGTHAVASTDAFAIGGVPTNPGNCSMLVARALVYNRILSSGERATIDAWLQSTYGI